MFEHLSILTGATPVSAVLDVSFGHNTITSSLSAALADKPRRRGVVLNHFFRISSPAPSFDVSVRMRNDLNCGTCDSEYNKQLNPDNRVQMFVKGGYLETSSVRVLVVEDSEAFRKFYCSTLGKRAELQIIGEVTDGLKAVQKAEELQPDLIVLDIGLPSLNGIEVARRVRKVSPKSKILFVSQEVSDEVVGEALNTGARGYVIKTDAGSELMEALDAVLRGERFVGKRLSGHGFVGASDAGASQDLRGISFCAQSQQNIEIASRHDVKFYSDDATL